VLTKYSVTDYTTGRNTVRLRYGQKYSETAVRTEIHTVSIVVLATWFFECSCLSK